MEQNEALTAKFLDDKEFRGAVSRYLLKPGDGAVCHHEATETLR
jgi:hypothetical protein